MLFDNCTSLIENDKDQEFLKLLHQLQEDCKGLRIMTTSSVSLGNLPGHDLNPYLLKSLELQESVDLFNSICNNQDLDEKEVLELIMRDKNFPF